MAVLAAALKNMKVIQVHGIERKNMIVALVILWMYAVIEFVLILRLAAKNEETRKEIKEIKDFLEKYTEKNQKSNDKMSETIKVLADKVIELYKRF